MKHILITFAIVLGVMAMIGTTNGAEKKAQFPLMAWDYATDDATLKKMADCGINMVAFVPPKMLDACSKHGIRAIVFNENFNAYNDLPALSKLIKKVNSHPAVFGYHLKDEPSAAEYPGLAKAVELVEKEAPGKWPYINLLPGGGDAYDKYIEDFCTVCKPPILSYDLYAIQEDGGFSDGFWVTLARFRDAGLRHNLPFYNIVLTSPHWRYRELTQTDLRMQTFGSLVYGCKGLSYYKFYSGSLPGAPDLGNFHMGPLDEFGEKTQVWDWLRNINRQILNLGPTLLKLRSDDVYHFGATVPDKNHGPSDKSLVKALKDGENWIAGDFTHEDGSRWVMIVNKDLKRSFPVQPEFNMPVKSVEYINPVTGQLLPYTTPYYFYLAPGQGVLLRLE